MKKILFALLTVFLFISCDNEDLATKINESNDLYVFRGIEYSLEEGDSLVVTELTSDILPEAYDSVSFRFCPDHYLPYILRSNEALTIQIPESITGNEIILSSDTWNYSENNIGYLKPCAEETTKSTEATPKKAKEELTVTYTATFKGMVTQNEIKLKGKLKRECFRH